MTDHIPEVDGRRRRRGSEPRRQAERPGQSAPTSKPSQQAAPRPKPQTNYVDELLGQAPSPSQSQSPRPTSSGSSGFGNALGGLGGLLGGLSGSGAKPSASNSPTGAPGSRRGCGSIIFLILLAILLFFLWRSCSKQAEDMPPASDNDLPSLSQAQTTRPPQATQPQQAVSVEPTQASAQLEPGQKVKWLVMAYIDADDKALERDLMFDLNEMELIGSSDEVIIVAQVDRYAGGYSGDGNWSGTRRFYITPDQDLNVTASQYIDIGEVDMGDPKTLVDFVSWATDAVQADRYMLLMSDHGMGWPGGWSDPTPGGNNSSNAPLARAMQDPIILLNEFEWALKEIQRTTPIEKFDLIGLDVCLMSQMEVHAMLAPYARFVVASEETEPGVGWAYEAFLSLMVYDPNIATADIAKNIVETYLTQDQRVQNDQARAEFLNQNTSGGGWYVNRMSAEQLGAQLERNSTLAAIDLAHYPELLNALNNFAYSLQGVDQRAVAQARSYAQSYTSIFGQNVPASYIDMGHFAALAAKFSGDQNVYNAANTLLQTLQKAVIANKAGSGKPGSTGIAIYFPNSQLYQNNNTGMASYTVIADTFAKTSLWDDFLGFHYTGRQFQANAVEPVILTRASQIPGSGEISVSEIKASSDRVVAGDEIELDITVTGENIAYIYFFTGIVADDGSIYVADTDYVESGQTQQENNVYYPVWPQGNQFKLNFSFEPILYAITDGDQEVMALFDPVDYGRNYHEAVYVVNGTYTFKETGEQRPAQLRFMDEKLYQVMGFTGISDLGNGLGGGGGAWEITPNAGDSFTVKESWLIANAQGQITKTEQRDGDTIVFTGKPIEAISLYLPKGKAVIGFMVSDHDGQIRSVFKEITVE